MNVMFYDILDDDIIVQSINYIWSANNLNAYKLDIMSHSF